MSLIPSTILWTVHREER